MSLQRQIDELLARRASQWLETLRHASKPEREAFLDWLSASKLHAQEFLEIVAVDRELARLNPQRGEDVNTLIGQIAPAVVPIDPGAWTPLNKEASQHKTRRWLRTWALVAGIAVVGVLTPLLKAHFFTAPQAIVTQVGEQRTLELPDSSLVTLNTDSQISLEMGAAQRNVRLLHGEALFKVARDMRRPFLVHTRAGVIQAVGTQFNVYDKPRGTLVSVLEGRVKITSSTGASTQMLGVGQQALLQVDGPIQLEPQAVVTRTIA